MQPGPRDFKKHIASGGKIISTWCSIPSAFTAEMLARAGFDAVVVDLQHGLQDYETALHMLQAIDGQGVPTLCRVHWNEPGIIMKVLDAGFGGVICPMINTVEEARQFGSACRYAPRGIRSYGPLRAALVHGADYGSTANDWLVALPMIETMEGFANLDGILTLPEIDGVYIGPTDLCLSMGYPPSLLPPPPVLEVIGQIRDKAQAAGKIAGIHCGSAAMVSQMLTGGFNMATLLSDMRYLQDAMGALLAQARGTAAAPLPSSRY
ncbi:4-hydroxy-2-oxo-heptane-1,7-dioate aldolase [compost metagenome]